MKQLTILLTLLIVTHGVAQSINSNLKSRPIDIIHQQEQLKPRWRGYVSTYDSADLQSVPTQYIDNVKKKIKRKKNKLGLIIGMGTDCKSALSYMTDFFTYPSDRVMKHTI
jgi:hypothetical protein